MAAVECMSLAVEQAEGRLNERKYSTEYEQFSKQLTELPSSCEYIGRIKKLLTKLGELDNGVHSEQLRRQFSDIDTLFAERSRFEEFTSNADREWIEADYERECRAAQREFDDRVQELREQLIEKLEAERRALETERSQFDLVSDGGEQKTMCTRNLRKRTETTAFVTRASRASGFEPDTHAHVAAAASGAAAGGAYTNTLAFGTAFANTTPNGTLARYTALPHASVMAGSDFNAATNGDAKRPRRMSPTQLNFLLNDEEIQNDLLALRNSLVCDSPSRNTASAHTASGQRPISNAGRSNTLTNRRSVAGRHTLGVSNSRSTLSSPFRSTAASFGNTGEPYRFNVLPYEATCDDGKLVYNGRTFKPGQPVSVEFRGGAEHRETLSRRRFAAFIKTVTPNEIMVKRTIGETVPLRITLHDLANGRVVLTRRS